MPSTKLQYAEQIMRIISKGDIQKDFPFDEREIIRYIDQVRDDLLTQEILADYKKNGTYTLAGDYVFSYFDIPIVLDADRGNAPYAELPSRVLKLPEDRGVFQVSLMTSINYAMIPLRAGTVSLRSGLPQGRIQGRTGYHIEGQRVYIVVNTPANPTDLTLHMRLVSTSEGVDNDAFLPIPPNLEARMIELVLARFGVVNPDKITDESTPPGRPTQ